MQFSDWAAGAAAVAAWIAVLYSHRGLQASRRALHLAEQQEDRHKTNLALYLNDGYVKTVYEGQRRLYAFLLSVSNLSDSDNAIARLDLRVAYRTSAGFETAVIIPALTGEEHAFGGDGQSVLQAPVRMDAHQTVAGWAYFSIKADLLRDCDLDSYRVIVTDSHEDRKGIELTIVREFFDETQTNVPKETPGI